MQGEEVQPTQQELMDGNGVIRWIDGHEEQLIEQLRGWVDLNSGLDNEAGRQQMIDALQLEYESLGFQCRRLHHEQGFTHLVAMRPSAKPDALKVLLLGHVDTVYDSDGTFLSFQREGEWASGPGVGDMKGGLVVTLAMLRALQSISRLDDFDWVAVHNSDEEIGSPTSRDVIERMATGRDLCLDFEIGRSSGAVVRSRAGVGAFFCEVEGKSAHAGMEPEKGINAVLAASTLMAEVVALADHSRGTKINIGRITGGNKRNIVAENCRFEIDVRVQSTKEAERVERALHDLKGARASSLPWERGSAQVHLFGRFSRPPWPRGAASDRLAGHFQTVANDLGIDLPAEDTGGGSDANFPAALGVATIDALGPVGEGTHTHHERIRVHTVASRAKLCAIALLRWQRSEPVMA